ncbi:unnamed protein product [Staurois parvus]|uniref:Uncharacterized protein n=1 Tax=Staurois parvus TaxID=386267 RepID=A0ABN9HFP8_9NEOB|nr:unnamed protein product [Staurois parvus]
MCRVTPYDVLSGDKRGGNGRREGSEKSGSNSIFTQCRGLTPSIVSITSMRYCIYRLILLLWV